MHPIQADWSGQSLAAALCEPPMLTLSFYRFGILLRKVEGERVSEYPVDAAHIAQVLATQVTFDTGLLNANTLLVREAGTHRLVVEYRPPGKTGLFVEGAETPLRLPLPGLILIRLTDGTSARYQVYAVKRRPQTLDIPVFHAPLPNVFGVQRGGGSNICWGSVPQVTSGALHTIELDADWKMLLGSPFGDHAVQGKSKAYRGDIRQQWIALEKANARVYPTADLIPVERSLAQVLPTEER